MLCSLFDSNNGRECNICSITLLGLRAYKNRHELNTVSVSIDAICHTDFVSLSLTDG